MLPVKPKTKMTRSSYIAFAFVFVLLLAGCSKNADQQASDSLYWTAPGDEIWIPPSWATNLLFLQLSTDPVVYISQTPQGRELTEDEMNDGVIVMPSTLDDILPRIAVFQGEMDAINKGAAVVIGGDDRASCISILKAIDYAKKAKVDIFFETLWRDSGRAFDGDYYPRNIYLKYFEFPSGFKPSPELAKNIITISISRDGVFQWEDTTVTLQEFINRLENLMKGDRDKVLFVVRVDGDTSFYHLRYALDQLRRGGFFRVMVARR